MCVCVCVCVCVSEIKATDFRLTSQKFLIQIHFIFSNVISSLMNRVIWGEFLQSVLNYELRLKIFCVG